MASVFLRKIHFYYFLQLFYSICLFKVQITANFLYAFANTLDILLLFSLLFNKANLIEMKIRSLLTLLLTLTYPHISFSATEIKASEAAFYDGKNVIACGVLKEVSQFKRGFYLNLDDHYPKQSLTLVMWEDDIPEFTKQFGSIEKLINRNICGSGKITTYKGRKQISLYNSFSLRTS